MRNFICIEPETEWFDPLLSFYQDWCSERTHILNRTSGSTGQPKDLSVSKDKMRLSASRTNAFFGNNEHTLMLLCLPAAYIAGRMMVVRALQAGSRLICTRPALNPMKRITADMPIQFAAFTPAQVAEIRKDPHSFELFRKISTVILGGAPLSPQLRDFLHAEAGPGQKIYETYGMTETLSHIAVKNIKESAFRCVSADIQLSCDNNGCLHIQDKQLLDAPLQTRDRVTLHADGSFIWLGRMDFVINSGGIKIHPEELEKHLSAHPQLTGLNYYIGKKADEHFGEVPVLYIESAPFVFRIEEMQGLIARNTFPREIIFRPVFQYTENGKIKRES